jgi:hypothetical protein
MSAGRSRSHEPVAASARFFPGANVSPTFPSQGVGSQSTRIGCEADVLLVFKAAVHRVILNSLMGLIVLPTARQLLSLLFRPPAKRHDATPRTGVSVQGLPMRIAGARLWMSSIFGTALSATTVAA